MAQTPPDPPILKEEEDEVCFGCDSNIDSPASTEISQRPAEQVCPGPPRSRSRVHSGPPAPPILNEEDDEVYFGSDSNIDTTEKSQRPAEQVCPGPPRSRSRVHSGPPAPPILNEEDDEVYFGSDFNIERPVSTELSRRPAEQPLLRCEIFWVFSPLVPSKREKYILVLLS